MHQILFILLVLFVLLVLIAIYPGLLIIFFLIFFLIGAFSYYSEPCF